MTEPTLEAVVVTDDEELRHELRVNLEDEGFAVKMATTTAEAIALVTGRSSTPRLVLVDPGVQGLEPAQLAAGLRAVDLLLTIPVSMTQGGKGPMDIEDVYDCARLFKDEGAGAVAARAQAYRATWRQLAARASDAERAAVKLARRARDDTPRG